MRILTPLAAGFLIGNGIADLITGEVVFGPILSIILGTTLLVAHCYETRRSDA